MQETTAAKKVTEGLQLEQKADAQLPPDDKKLDALIAARCLRT
jgi:hypothetical protein